MTNPFKEMRSCNSCGAPFECYITATKRHCSHQCGHVGRKNAHHLIYTSEYSAWRDMKARCYRTTHKDYVKYGARGIAVCDRWRNSFQNFYADMGPKPQPGLSIERKDNDGNYEPSNCKWADKFEQARNRRGVWTQDENDTLRILAAAGHTFPEIAKALGKPGRAVQARAYRLRIQSGLRRNTFRASTEVALHERLGDA